jgi:hypothetical protein
MWSFEEIRDAITIDRSERIKPLRLGLSDFFIPVGVGVGPEDSIVLIVPGEEYENSVAGSFFTFDPWTTIYPEGLNEISGVGLLVIRFPSISDVEIDALSSLFLGIIQMQIELGRSAKSGRVIRSLSALFDSRLKLEVDHKAVVGLTGELLAIHRATDTDFMISAWRSKDMVRYDFSSNGMRLEVKTSTRLFREHDFSSNQLPPLHGVDLAVLSILYYEVEDGMSFSELFNLIWKKVDSDELKLKLLSVCMETLGSHPNFIELPKFDLLNTFQSMMFYPPSQIPQPIMAPGVVYMKWTAVLPDELTDTGDLGENDFVSIVDCG